MTNVVVKPARNLSRPAPAAIPAWYFLNNCLDAS